MDARAVGLVDRASYRRLDLVPLERDLRRYRNTEHHPAAARQLLFGDARRAERVVDPVSEAQSARAHVERGELVRAVADHRDTERLEALERQREIEHELRASGHHAHGVARDGFEIRGLVERALRATVHATDAAGGAERDPGPDGGVRRTGHWRARARRSRRRAALRRARAPVAILRAAHGPRAAIPAG